MPPIPVSRPDIGALESQLAAEAVASTWVAGGPFVERFEQRWASLCGATHGVSCCNGTAALHLVLRSLGIRPGDEVIVPTLTYVATAAAVVMCGADPVFVDCDEWGCLDPAAVREARWSRTKAVIAVHLYGHPADMVAVQAAAGGSVVVIEDAAEAHGARYRGRPAGSLGQAATWSFYGNKIVTCGEGGMVTTSSPKLAQRMRYMRGQAQDPERRFWHADVGYNYRLNNVSAAIGCAQLERFGELQAKRSRVREWYAADVGHLMPPVAPWAEPATWLVNVLVDNRDAVAAKLAERGIETRPGFPCVHTMPPYRHCEHVGKDRAESLSARLLSLPTYSGMDQSDVRRVCAALKEAVA